jgi:hypothetical protein
VDKLLSSVVVESLHSEINRSDHLPSTPPRFLTDDESGRDNTRAEKQNRITNVKEFPQSIITFDEDNSD